MWRSSSFPFPHNYPCNSSSPTFIRISYSCIEAISWPEGRAQVLFKAFLKYVNDRKKFLRVKCVKMWRTVTAVLNYTHDARVLVMATQRSLLKFWYSMGLQQLWFLVRWAQNGWTPIARYLLQEIWGCIVIILDRLNGYSMATVEAQLTSEFDWQSVALVNMKKYLYPITSCLILFIVWIKLTYWRVNQNSLTCGDRLV